MLAIGLMSGTSRDGIDAALLRTDGETAVEPVGFHAMPYHEGFRIRLTEACTRAMDMDAPGFEPLIASVEAELTQLHVEAVSDLLARTGMQAEDIDVIGFHGHTVAHRPERGWTWQIGNGGELAGAFGIPVVDSLRVADVAAGGQGAPLLPVYHRALAAGLARPAAVLNLGGVANITWIGADDRLIAFDTGMASGLIDNWMQAEANADFDAGGATAATGRVHEAVLAHMLANPWFDEPPPKSIDREHFTLDAVRGLSPADGAATLTAFTARSVARGIALLPEKPVAIHVAGGGRHNGTMMRMLAQATGLEVLGVDRLGWNGDGVEAEGFAYMAVRSLKGLPISFPGTTGCPAPMTGGVVHRPE
jgi:anhydro-N-acetylmuramic acid kinase